MRYLLYALSVESAVWQVHRADVGRWRGCGAARRAKGASGRHWCDGEFGTYHQYPVHTRHHQILVQLARCVRVFLGEVVAERIQQAEMGDLGQLASIQGSLNLTSTARRLQIGHNLSTDIRQNTHHIVHSLKLDAACSTTRRHRLRHEPLVYFFLCPEGVVGVAHDPACISLSSWWPISHSAVTTQDCAAAFVGICDNRRADERQGSSGYRGGSGSKTYQK